MEILLDDYKNVLTASSPPPPILSVATVPVRGTGQPGEIRPVAAHHSPTISGSESKLHRLYFDILAKYDASEREKQFEDGLLDQKILYLDYQSLDHWTNLVNCRIYTTYWDCLAALSLLVKSPTWSKFFDDGNVGSLYILGAGAPDKDYAVIQNLASSSFYNSNNKLNYVILDTSLPMLAYTIDRLHELTKFQDHMDRIELARFWVIFWNSGVFEGTWQFTHIIKRRDFLYPEALSVI